MWVMPAIGAFCFPGGSNRACSDPFCLSSLVSERVDLRSIEPARPGKPMLLKLTRSQRATFVKQTAVFMLDARVSLNREEYDNVQRYRLMREVVYTSAAAQRHQDAALDHLDGSAGGLARGLGRLALAKMNLTISIGGLINGTHVECKDLSELMGAEEAVIQACQNLKGFLDTAATFDGREILVEFDKGKPKVVEAPTPQIAVERTDTPPVIDGEYQPLPPPEATVDVPAASGPAEWWRNRTQGQTLALTLVLLVIALGIATYFMWPRKVDYSQPQRSDNGWVPAPDHPPGYDPRYPDSKGGNR